MYLFLCEFQKHRALTIIDPLKPSETCSRHQNPPFPSETQRGKSGEKLRKSSQVNLTIKLTLSILWVVTPLHGVQGYLKAQMHQYSIIGRVQLLKLGKLTFSMAKLKGLSAHIKNQIA